MGRRSPTESVARIYRAFLRQRTWSQAALAREIEIGIPALRKRLDELTALGMPLDRDDRDPPQIYWSVPASWFPDSVAFDKDEVGHLLHVLWHTARGRRRDKLLRLVLDARRDRAAIAATDAAIVAHETSEAEETFLPVVEEAMARHAPVRMRFYSTERGIVESRHVSVHRVDVGPPARLAGTCHRTDQLKWFRVDNIVEVTADGETPFRSAGADSIRQFCADSIDGFRGEGEAREHVFFVREPEARWVAKNLLAPMRAEQADGGIVVAVRTAGVLRVARYVVGLGGAARVDSEPLRMLVEDLAKGALRRIAKPRKLAKAQGMTAERPRRRANR
jgi:predicted DNA-binding transcriptional regulator YafY